MYICVRRIDFVSDSMMLRLEFRNCRYGSRPPPPHFFKLCINKPRQIVSMHILTYIWIYSWFKSIMWNVWTKAAQYIVFPWRAKWCLNILTICTYITGKTLYSRVECWRRIVCADAVKKKNLNLLYISCTVKLVLKGQR